VNVDELARQLDPGEQVGQQPEPLLIELREASSWMRTGSGMIAGAGGSLDSIANVVCMWC
jgi:hypothetical protein